MLPRARCTLGLLVVSVALALLGAPAAARAGIVTVTYVGKYGQDAAPQFSTSPGEVSRITLSDAGAAQILHDDGAPVELGPLAGSVCSRVDAKTLRCSPQPFAAIYLGDGDDTFSAARSSRRIYVRSGRGDDLLVGGPGGDDLSGGPGADRILGGRGTDLVYGEAGDDVLDGQSGDDVLLPGAGANRLDGGAGRDAVSTSSEREGARQRVPIGVDLARGLLTAPGEHDVLRSIESASGSAAAGVLKGTDGPNNLSGNGLLVGRGGDDVLTGGFDTPSRYDAGPGNDVLESWSRGDRLSCGTGEDLVRPHSPADAPPRSLGDPVVPTDCERVAFDELGMTFTRGRALRDGFRLAVGSFASRAVGPRRRFCRAVLTIGPPRGRPYGRVQITRPSTRLAVALGPRGRRAARRHRLLELRLTSPCLGWWERSGWRTRL